MEVALKRVYAIIVSWNGAGWIREALESLRQSAFPVRIVVVDNASTDETVHIIRDLYPEVELLRQPSNLGFGKANNQGIRYALSQGADYVLLLNQDAKVDPATVGSLVNLLNEYPDFGILSPLHLDYQGTGIDPIFLKFIRNDVRLISDAFFGRLQGLYEVPFVPAAVWLLTRQVLEAVGGFDPIFFMYGEDRDFCDRVQFHGFKIGVAPKVLAYHWHDQRNGDTHRTFGTQCAILYATLLYDLTRPGHRSFRKIRAMLRWIRLTIVGLLNFKFSRSLAMVLALLKVLINGPRIWQRHSQLEGNWEIGSSSGS
jgi:GT2 family glycosyltransferase